MCALSGMWSGDKQKKKKKKGKGNWKWEWEWEWESGWQGKVIEPMECFTGVAKGRNEDEAMFDAFLSGSYFDGPWELPGC